MRVEINTDTGSNFEIEVTIYTDASGEKILSFGAPYTYNLDGLNKALKYMKGTSKFYIDGLDKKYGSPAFIFVKNLKETIKKLTK